MAVTLFPWLFLGPVLLLAQADAVPTSARHSVSIDIRGPLALVEVERPLAFGAEYGRKPSDEAVVDLDLPVGSTFIGGEIKGEGTDLHLFVRPSAETPWIYNAALRAAGWQRASVPVDDGVDLRLRVAAPEIGKADHADTWSLRYRFVAPLACRDGRFVMTVPGDLDPTPTDADVTVRVDTGDDVRPVMGIGLADRSLVAHGRAPMARGRGRVSTRRPWDIVLDIGSSSSDPLAIPALSAWAPAARGGGLVAAALCRPASKTRGPAPTRLMLLIDRSRSVGPGGASSARDLARALVEGLPPSLTFNAVFFDRAVETLFPVPRQATVEALDALQAKVGLGTLANGTELTAALRRAVALGDGDPGRGAGPAAWVVITDGAVPEDQTASALGQAVSRLTPRGVEAAVLVLRGETDERTSPFARRALGAIPAQLGGIYRELPVNTAAAAAASVIDGLRAGGDLVDPRLLGGGLSRDQALDEVGVAPGAGARLLVRAGATGGALTLRAAHAGRPVSWVMHPVRLPAAWAVGLATSDAPTWLSAPVGQALPEPPHALALLTPPPSVDSADAVVRGQMDRDILHKALTYAFLPRARACYLNRAIKTAGDFALKGRIRLELEVERGEMMNAVVKSSTLGRPGIEACLREAAFAVEIPRPFNRDAPVVAALNLVFQPRTESATATPRVSSFDREMDRVLGPLPTGSDFLELLIDTSPTAPPGR